MTGNALSKPRRNCPICAGPSRRKFHPFCSLRCSEIDLERWLGGRYAIPAGDEEPDASSGEERQQ